MNSDRIATSVEAKVEVDAVVWPATHETHIIAAGIVQKYLAALELDETLTSRMHEKGVKGYVSAGTEELVVLNDQGGEDRWSIPACDGVGSPVIRLIGWEGVRDVLALRSFDRVVNDGLKRLASLEGASTPR